MNNFNEFVSLWKGIEKWVFEEIQSMNEMLFRFKDKEKPMGYARQLANSIHSYPMPEILSGPWIAKEWNPDLVQEVRFTIYLTLLKTIR